ncbi:hypothetical protein [Bifidobacterium sp. ESL0790]|uniref:hypothetical protein n=1 Tax=Bifidobacterium sp. ESL0790 TaxID=2983233 RepID=UPI0023F81564|nr:hypothetical protein [Bifidobacterium sp. ESL0790]WEV72117.1 hypothetical protein OZY47_06670 [Bifidobacterium sp. ESL0790]
MTITRANKIAACAVKILHDKQLLSKIPKTKIAKQTAVSRVTVSKRLEANDISLTALIATADAIDVDPTEVLKQAIAESESTKTSTALADD